MRIRCALVMILAFCLFIWVPTVNSQTRKPLTIGMIAGPFGTGSFLLCSAVMDIGGKNHPWLRISHSESPGYVFNIKKLDKEPELKETMIVGSGGVLSWMASEGLKPFDKKYPPVKLLGNFYLCVNWLATLDPKIKSGKDLVGKKIALGRTPQVNWAIEPDWIMRHGWGIRDKVEVQYVGPKPAMTALLDGLVDASIIGGFYEPSSMRFAAAPQTTELLASGRKVYSIPWGEEAVKKTIAAGMPITPITLSPNTLEGQDKPLAVYGDSSGWFASPEFPEELAYEFTKLVINNAAKFAEYGDIGKFISPKGLPYGGTPETIHPGALRAYKETGILN